ncbi:MAG: PucR family transcriptional regulator ligand-binding domain-containing protein, partial [Acidimicrobiales bacterium]
MSFTVGSLLEIEHLGLSLEAGASGLGRSLLWAHVCEIADPRPWLEGGELIMTTGMAVPRQARAQVAYVDRLCEAGVAGLGVAEGMSSPPLTAAMRERADEAGLPILRVSYEVPFIAISRVVFAANHETFERRMLRTLTIFDSLRRGSTVLDSTVAVLDRLEELSGYMLGVASTDRHLVLGDHA